jgi:hypothetical protein
MAVHAFQTIRAVGAHVSPPLEVQAFEEVDDGT